MYCAFFGWYLENIPSEIEKFEIITFLDEKETDENVLIDKDFKLPGYKFNSFYDHNPNNEKNYMSKNNTIYKIDNIPDFIMNISPVLIRPTNLLFKNEPIFYVILSKDGTFGQR